MIQVSNLSKSYGDKRAIQNLNFTLEKGEVVGLLGLNGAGKTTTIRILTGYLIPSSGDARINGKSIFDEPLEAKKKIGYLPESPPLYEELTIEDYLTFVARIKSVSNPEIHKEITRVMERTGTLTVKERSIGHLSLGYKKRVGIAQALIGNPDVIIMDEPISGLDPQQIIEIRNLIRSLSGEHTVLISSHILTEIYRTCDKFLFLHNGKLKPPLTLDELENELEKVSGLVLTLSSESGRTIDEIHSFLIGIAEGEGAIKYLETVRHGISFSINELNEKTFKQRLIQALPNSGLSLEYLKKGEASLEELFMNRFQEKK